jgi:hypothetical protein
MGRVRERELRRWCRRELRALDITPPLRVDELCDRLGERRGRPIRLVSFPLPVPGPFGVWLATDNADYIVFQSQTTRVHQDHIVLHEIGHMLAGHQADHGDPGLWTAALPDLSPDLVRRALGRNSYDARHEREAELIATIIMEWASVVDYATPHRSDTAAARALEAVFDDRPGWL